MRACKIPLPILSLIVFHKNWAKCLDKGICHIFGELFFNILRKKKKKKNTLNLGYLFYAPNFKMLPFVCCLLFSVSCAVKSWKKNHTIFVEWVASKWTSRNFSNIRGGVWWKWSITAEAETHARVKGSVFVETLTFRKATWEKKMLQQAFFKQHG